MPTQKESLVEDVAEQASRDLPSPGGQATPSSGIDWKASSRVDKQSEVSQRKEEAAIALEAQRKWRSPLVNPLELSHDPLWKEALETHGTRRGRGLPTISALVGRDPLSYLEVWATENDRLLMYPEGDTLNELLQNLAASLSFAECRSLIARFFARHVATAQGEGERTPYELSLLLSGLSNSQLIEDLYRSIQNSKESPRPLIARYLQYEGESGREPVLGRCLIEVKDREIYVIEELSPVRAQAFSRLAEFLPELTLVALFTLEGWESVMKTWPETRAKALLREGKVLLQEPDESRSISEHLGEDAVRGLQRSIDFVNRAEAQRPRIGEKFLEAVRRCRAVDRHEAAAAPGARSACEALLWEALEATDQTRGQFELNGRGRFDFGPGRPVEIDFLCRRLDVAIEVDGYYHFRTADDWRRDRRKDFELQRHGYLIRRFLAQDVVEDLSGVVESVVETMNARTA